MSEKERVYYGLAASPGIAHAVAFVFTHGEVEVPRYSVEPERHEEEISRFEQGLLETRKQVSAIRAEVEEKVGEDEAAIFDAHLLVLEDRALIEDTIDEVVQSGLNIEYCFQQVANRYIDAFAQIDDDYIKERVADIRDVTRRLVCNLLGREQEAKGRPSVREAHIMVAEDLSPSDTAVLELDAVMGIVTEHGSRTSHSVIMARSYNLPCVVGVRELIPQLQFGDELLIDGYEGVVYLNPTEETLYRYGSIKSKREDFEERFEREQHLPAVTTDGAAYQVSLNVEGKESEDMLRGCGGDGVGLFRTENLFMVGGFPDEATQYQRYREVVEAMAPGPVTIRTLDLGGDKNPHRSMSGYHEANPFMGFRGIRFCLEHRDVFKEQLRAILRASAHGTVRILYPMISNPEELDAANGCLAEAKDELRRRKLKFDEGLAVGSMIEVPSAAVVADLLAKRSDFFSIGTNDLIQYLLAVDRINDRIAHLYDPNHPAILRVLQGIFESGRRAGIPVSVCGELAGDARFAPLLLGMGATQLSVARGNIGRIKYIIRRISKASVEALAEAVLGETTAEGIRNRLEAYYRELTGMES